MYVAVKGGEAAIIQAHALVAKERRGPLAIPEITPEQIASQMTLAVARVMSEGSLYDPELASIAVKQARGDLIEAIFLVRVYRTTLPRFGSSLPICTGAMSLIRRISATFKDVPGGQILGPTFDYTHRLIDFSLAQSASMEPSKGSNAQHNNDPKIDQHSTIEAAPRVLDFLQQDCLIEPSGPRDSNEAQPGDITRAPLEFPASRDVRLQCLARGDEGFLLALGYSTQRGYGRTHPFAGEIRIGEVRVEIFIPELGFAVEIGEITVTECEMINQFKGSKKEPAQFTRGYGLVFGQAERKAMAMALVDRSLRAKDFGEESGVPAQDEEFVLSHCDNVQATGFVEHLKLPHYVDFQSELELVRRLRQETVQSTEPSDLSATRVEAS